MKIKEFYDIYYSNNILLYNHEINKITDDSNEIEDNDVFVCIKGHTCDGHDYIETAIQKGAKTIIVDENFSNLYKNVNIIKSKNTVKDLSRLLFLKYDKYYSKRPKFIGVTGTNGKTTTTSIVYEYLKILKKDVLYVGTNFIKKYYALKEEKFKSFNTTPKLTNIFKHLLTVPVSFDYVIMEVSSQGISEGRILGINFDIVLVKNLSKEHLDYHFDIDQYKMTKGNLVTSIASNKNAILILNNDLEYFNYFNNLNINKNIYYGKYNNSDCNKYYNHLSYQILEEDIDKTIFNLYFNNKIIKCETNLIGEFNIENLISSMSILYSLDLLDENIFSFIKSIPSVEGRMNIIEYNNRYFIIDFAHTSDAVEKVLKFFNKIKLNKIITVIGCGGNRDLEKRPIMGNLVINYSDNVVFTEDNPRFEDTLDIISDMISNSRSNNYEIITDRKEAIKKAYYLSEEKDFILIIGKGAESYIIRENKYYKYSDMDTVKEIINE